MTNWGKMLAASAAAFLPETRAASRPRVAAILKPLSTVTLAALALRSAKLTAPGSSTRGVWVVGTLEAVRYPPAARTGTSRTARARSPAPQAPHSLAPRYRRSAARVLIDQASAQFTRAPRAGDKWRSMRFAPLAEIGIEGHSR
jgi:hypothetical protein